MKEFLGTDNIGQFMIMIVYVLIGAAVSLLMNANARDPLSTATPVQFSISFFLKDNWKRITLTLLLVFVGVRFYSSLFQQEISPLLAFFMGLGLDKLSQIIKNNTSLITVKRDDPGNK